jgi:ribonuclease HII
MKINVQTKPAVFLHPDLLEAGLDEAGRGCLAGPVFAAAVILPKDFDNDVLTDSKMMTEKNRYKLRDIIEKEALAFAVASCTEAEIDEHNIANASYMAMGRAVKMLATIPEMLLVDGKYFKPYGLEIPFKCVIKGDQKFAAIAAASVLAKTYRDDWMKKWAPQYPEYFWHVNKGYPTQQHRDAIAQFGLTPMHRLTFRWDKGREGEQLRMAIE